MTNNACFVAISEPRHTFCFVTLEEEDRMWVCQVAPHSCTKKRQPNMELSWDVYSRTLMLASQGSLHVKKI